MSKSFPLLFILLWSSAFITTLPIVQNSDPFSALAFRFFLVAICFFIYSIYKKTKISVNSKDLVNSLGTGILFHGLYLGGVFYSIYIGFPTSLTALIVTMQPILTNLLAGYFLKEKVSLNQWLGVLLGFTGAVMVLGFDIGKSLPIEGVISSIIALIAITTSTIWQKKISNNIPLSVNNMYQAVGAVLFHLLIIIFILSIYNYYSSNKNVDAKNYNRKNIDQILREKIIDLPVLKNDTNNVIEFNNSLKNDIKENKKRSFWDLLKKQ